MNRLLRLAVPFFLLVLSPLPSPAAEETVNFREQVEKSNELIKSYRHFEAADTLKEATKLAGDRHPSLHMRLAILYYGLGLIPEAIAEGERAVALAPSSKWYKYDLGKFYYVDKQYSKAEQQFVALLIQDPGFTLGYPYLAELYYRNKNYDMAWLSLQRARLLGYQGKHLDEQLSRHTRKPAENLADLSPETMLFRFIKVDSKEEATSYLAEILKGKLYENFELELKREKARETDFGVMTIDKVKDTDAALLRQLQPFAPPVVIGAGSDFRIVQRIAPFNPQRWQAMTAAPVGHTKEAVSMVSAKGAASASPPPSSPGKHTETPLTTPAEMHNSKEQQQLSSQLEAFYALESWKNAWQAADVDSYLAAYSTQFIPANRQSLAAWKTQRTTSLSKPQFINLKINNPVIERLHDGRLQITFTQHFSSNIYRDTVLKALIMARENERWKILEERTLEVLEQ
jgi:hypothetical protein